MNRYNNAFTEVYVIISYLDDLDYNKIPKEIINVINENMNKGYNYYIDESISLMEQTMLPETKAILFNLFRDYLSELWQKEKIIKMQQEERLKNELQKIEKYNTKK